MCFGREVVVRGAARCPGRASPAPSIRVVGRQNPVPQLCSVEGAVHFFVFVGPKMGRSTVTSIAQSARFLGQEVVWQQVQSENGGLGATGRHLSCSNFWEMGGLGKNARKGWQLVENFFFVRRWLRARAAPLEGDYAETILRPSSAVPLLLTGRSPWGVPARAGAFFFVVPKMGQAGIA